MIDRANKIALIACILALIGFGYALIPQDVAFEVVLNNTNLAPSFVGEPPGTNERISGTTYWANTSAKQILLFAHAVSVADTATIELWVNGTMVLVTSGKPLGGAETQNKSLSMIIPKGSYYHAIFNNYHHYEWREYPIISGRNGTLSINQTIINSGGGGASFNGNPVDMNGSNMFNGSISNYSTNISLNASLNLKVNKSGDNMTGKLFINDTYGYTGAGRTIFGLGRNTTASIFSLSLNDLHGGFNFRINMLDSLDSSMPGSAWAMGFSPNISTPSLPHDYWSIQRKYPNSPTFDIMLAVYSNNSVNASKHFTAEDMAGVGKNYPVRSDESGKIEVNRTAGAGITMKAPNGNVYCVTVSNTGTFASASGACP